MTLIGISIVVSQQFGTLSITRNRGFCNIFIIIFKTKGIKEYLCRHRNNIKTKGIIEYLGLHLIHGVSVRYKSFQSFGYHNLIGCHREYLCGRFAKTSSKLKIGEPGDSAAFRHSSPSNFSLKNT